MEVDDPDQQYLLERISSTLRIVLEWKDFPSLLVSPQMLAALENTVRSNVKANLDTWLSNRNLAYLNNAYTNINTVLEVVRGWPPTKDRYGRAITRTMKRVAEESQQSLDILQKAVEESRTNLGQEVELADQKLAEIRTSAGHRLTELGTEAEQQLSKLGAETNQAASNIAQLQYCSAPGNDQPTGNTT